jgi:hypothetical protein
VVLFNEHTRLDDLKKVSNPGANPTTRVIRFGDFSPNWAIVYSGQFYENYRISQPFWTTFSPW